MGIKDRYTDEVITDIASLDDDDPEKIAHCSDLVDSINKSAIAIHEKESKRNKKVSDELKADYEEYTAGMNAYTNAKCKRSIIGLFRAENMQRQANYRSIWMIFVWICIFSIVIFFTYFIISIIFDLIFGIDLWYVLWAIITLTIIFIFLAIQESIIKRRRDRING